MTRLFLVSFSIVHFFESSKIILNFIKRFDALEVSFSSKALFYAIYCL